jgi:hypothetical protein
MYTLMSDSGEGSILENGIQISCIESKNQIHTISRQYAVQLLLSSLYTCTFH